jgi:type II secretory pathway component PulF
MPWFKYEGLTPGGTAIAGEIEAVDRERALDDLSQMRIEVRELDAAASPRKHAQAIGEEDLVFFNEQLASLAEAGIALDEGLAQLARDIESPRLRRWIEGIVADLHNGVSIDRAIAAREQGLPLLYSRVVRAGIDSGELPATLLNLNQHLRLSSGIRRMLWEILSYPLLVAGLACTVISLFFLLVAPGFRGIFESFGTRLPKLTLLVIDIADNYVIILLVLACLIGGVVLGWQALRLSRAGLAFRETIVLGMPILGRVYRASLISRFLRSVSTAVATGIPLPQAMRLAGDATGSMRLSGDAERLAAEVERGQSVFVASQSASLVPPLFGFCVQVATGRGTLPVALGQLARSYENRAYTAQGWLRVILLPLVVILLGGFLAFVILAMFLPLTQLINSVSGGS